jgi:hypothetical protein
MIINMNLIKLKNQSLATHLMLAGLILNFGNSYVHAEDITVAKERNTVSVEKKIQLRLTDIGEETGAADRAENSYYVERKSYGTAKETDPPRYVKQANKTWLKNYESFADNDWLDLGLEQRSRYEYRDNDFRRNDQRGDKRGSQTLDEPLLLRTRAYIGIKNILDPLRFA